MLAHLTHRSLLLCRFVLVLTLSVIGSGCSPWPVYDLYDGPKRPLKEVAVLFVQWPPLAFWQIDGKLVPGAAYSTNEYHLPPGEHSFDAGYTKDTGSYSFTGGRRSTSLSLSAGRCYLLQGKVHDEDGNPVSLDQPFWGTWRLPDKILWDLECKPLKTIGEMAPSLAKKSRAPPHWSELAERQSPSSGPKDEQ